MNKIVIELCPEDRAALDAIISGMNRLADALAAHPDPKSHTLGDAGLTVNLENTGDDRPVENPDVAGDLPWDPAPDPAPDSAPDPAPDPEPMTLAELQKNVATRCAKDPGIKNAIRSLVHEYAESVSGIPEDKRSEFMARLKKL